LTQVGSTKGVKPTKINLVEVWVDWVEKMPKGNFGNPTSTKNMFEVELDLPQQRKMSWHLVNVQETLITRNGIFMTDG
jgi:hypothetical protein